MTSLRHAKERGKHFACARGLEIAAENGDCYELDVFMLVDGKIPVCIECKSSEFRQNIDRYQTLKKRLGIDSAHFIMCVAGLSDDNARAFSAMYNLTFVNERSLKEHLSRLFKLSSRPNFHDVEATLPHHENAPLRPLAGGEMARYAR